MSDPTVSVIIPTVARASLLRATESALAQVLPDGWVEVIIVNDTGAPLDPGCDELLVDPRVTLVTTNRRRIAGARNTGAAIARASYLLFLDDDDWLLPGGLALLAGMLDGASDVVAAYGSSVVIGTQAGEDKEQGVLNAAVHGNCASPMLAGVFVPVGSCICRADVFWQIGGFDTSLGCSEDIDLMRAISLRGSFLCTAHPVHVYYRGVAWASTADYAASVDELRVSRETMLDSPAAFGRLAASAQSDYWRARNVKAYAASVLWNLRHGRLLRATSRSLYCFGAAVLSIPGLFSREYWRGVADVQVPGSMQYLLDAACSCHDSPTC